MENLNFTEQHYLRAFKPSYKVLEKLQGNKVPPHEEAAYDSKDRLFSSVDWEDELLTCSHLEDKRFLPRLRNYHRDADAFIIDNLEHKKDQILMDREYIEKNSSKLIACKRNYRKHRLEEAKKSGKQGFAGYMSNIAFSIRRKSAVVEKKCSIINSSSDTAGALPLLKTLLKAVRKFDKALTEVFERFDVTIITPKKNDLYDGHKHTATSIEPSGPRSFGIIAAVRWPGFMIHGEVKCHAKVVVKHGGQSSQTSNEQAESGKASGESEIPGQASEAGSDPKDALFLADLYKLEFESIAYGRLYDKARKIMILELVRYSEHMDLTIDQEARSMECYVEQNFAVSLLDVVDNLKRAHVNVKKRFLNIDASKDTSGTVSLLKTLLADVKQSNKSIVKAFKLLGVRAFYPINEHFNPERHSAALQVQDTSKLPGIVGVVLEHGYTYRPYKSKDVRVIRAAKVGVTQ